MKKSLIALALLSALSVCAQAADIKIYGKVDVGLMYTSIDNGAAGADRQNSLSMLSGQTAGSRVGITGWEDLGNGYKVGFKLENGFNTDTGTMAQSGRLFGRQADVRVTGPFGTLKIGRMGALASGYPDTGLFGGNMSPFAVGFGDVPGHRFVFAGDFSPLDNAITYSTPSFAGWQVIGQYSLDRNSQDKYNGTTHGVEGESTTDKFYALAVHFQNSTTEFNAVIDSTNYASFGVDHPEWDDSFVFTVGARHTTDIATWYGAAQYFKDARDFLQEAYQCYGSNAADKFLTNKAPRDGYGFVIGADIPVSVGIVKAAVGYMDAEDSNDSSTSLKRYTVSLGYWYDFSKRTALYADIGYLRDDLDGKNYKNYDAATAYTANLGLVHNF